MVYGKYLPAKNLLRLTLTAGCGIMAALFKKRKKTLAKLQKEVTVCFSLYGGQVKTHL